MTQIKLKLISDIGKYYFVDNGLRGGISYISKKFSELNNIYSKIVILQKKVNTSQILMQIIYLVGQ